jgi:hypothetical protein
MKFKLTKKHIDVLDKIMQAEIIGKSMAQMKKSKAVNSLLEAEFIKEVELTLGGRFQVRCKGYGFTDRGHIYYCEWCATNVEDE